MEIDVQGRWNIALLRRDRVAIPDFLKEGPWF
jgi:hypothetical protein